jgi:molecular chaperone GrpE
MTERQQPTKVRDADDSEDLEIIEVVGMDREAAPPSPEAGAAAEGAESSSAAGLSAPEAPDAADAGAAEEGFDADGISADERQLLRLRADYDNLRKRIDRERQEFELHANSRLVARLLPILDNFERALAIETDAEMDRAFREGCVMIYKQLTDELRRQGLQPIETAGQPFDPEIHDAVATDAGAAQPPNTIIEELRRGYLFRNRLLRPAMVKVSTNGNGTDGSD